MRSGFTGCGKLQSQDRFERARIYPCHKRSKMIKGFSPRGMFFTNSHPNADFFRSLFIRAENAEK
jgi:hypothetical protein